MSAVPCGACARGLGCSACGAILTTDPVALAASLPADVMLAALVRAGVLTEERHRVVPSKGARPKRLVTPWEVAP